MMDKQIKLFQDDVPEQLERKVNHFLAQRYVYSPTCMYQVKGDYYTVMIEFEHAGEDVMKIIAEGDLPY